MILADGSVVRGGSFVENYNHGDEVNWWTRRVGVSEVRRPLTIHLNQPKNADKILLKYNVNEGD